MVPVWQRHAAASTDTYYLRCGQDPGVQRSALAYPIRASTSPAARPKGGWHETCLPGPAVSGPEAADTLYRGMRASDAWLPAVKHPDPQLFASIQACGTWLECAQLLEAEAPGFDPMLLSAIVTQTVHLYHGRAASDNELHSHSGAGRKSSRSSSSKGSRLQAQGPPPGLSHEDGNTSRSSSTNLEDTWGNPSSTTSSSSSSPEKMPEASASFRRFPTGEGPELNSSSSSRSTSTTTSSSSSTNTFLWQQPPSRSWHGYLDALAALILHRLGEPPLHGKHTMAIVCTADSTSKTMCYCFAALLAASLPVFPLSFGGLGVQYDVTSPLCSYRAALLPRLRQAANTPSVLPLPERAKLALISNSNNVCQTRVVTLPWASVSASA